MFKTNGRPVAPGDQKLGWTSWIWHWASKDYDRLHKDGNFLNTSGRLSENFILKHCLCKRSSGNGTARQQNSALYKCGLTLRNVTAILGNGRLAAQFCIMACIYPVVIVGREYRIMLLYSSLPVRASRHARSEWMTAHHIVFPFVYLRWLTEI